MLNYFIKIKFEYGEKDMWLNIIHKHSNSKENI